MPQGENIGDAAPAGAIGDWLEAAAARTPDKIFIHSIDQGRAVTYGETRSLARRMGNYLAARGIGANGRVALLSNNSLEHLGVYLGTLSYGATICTIHVEMNQVYFADILKAVDPALVLYEDGLGLEDLADRLPGTWMRLGEWRGAGGSGFFAELEGIDDSTRPDPVNTRDDIAAIFYTSGTATRPKGVVCSYAELIDVVAPTADAFGIGPEDRVLDYRSFNWVSAQVLSALAPLQRGATLLLARRFSRSRFFDWVRDHDATIAAGNPTVINMLINRPVDISADDVPHLRFITSSSAPLLVEQWKRFEEMYGVLVCQGYGTSETHWIAGSNERTRRLGTVGRPLPYHRLAIVDGEGRTLPAGETGLIELGGDPDREYRYLGDDGGLKVNARGRIRTGDIGFLDDDGYLRVTGREKDLIIRGGVNISPTEIDNVVLQLANVAEAAAIGVPDDTYGEEVVLYVAVKPGRRLDETAILDHCQRHLAQQKMPKQVIFRDALPKTERGKMDRAALVEDWKRERPVLQE